MPPLSVLHTNTQICNTNTNTNAHVDFLPEPSVVSICVFVFVFLFEFEPSVDQRRPETVPPLIVLCTNQFPVTVLRTNQIQTGLTRQNDAKMQGGIFHRLSSIQSIWISNTLSQI